MLNYFRDLLKLPDFETEDDARIGGIFQNVLLVTWTFPILIAALAVVFPSSLPSLLVPGVSVIILLVILSILLRRGFIRAGSILLVSGLVIIATYLNYRSGGEFSSTFVVVVTIILMGGLLLGTRGALITFIVIVGEQAVLGWAGAAGLIHSQTQAGISAPWTNYVVTFTGYFVSMIIFQISASSLSKQLEISRGREIDIRSLSKDLDLRVQQRTLELNRRSGQLEAAALVARAAAEIRGQKELLETIVQQISERFGFYHTGIFLTDTNGEYVLLEAASSEGGRNMIQRGHKLAIGRQGIVGSAAFQKRPRIVQDAGPDSVLFNNPDLPETHSEIALPLLARDRLVGVLDIQSEEHNTFSDEDISTLQIMADQIALAIENARLLNESQSAIDELQTMTTKNITGTWRERLGYQNKGYSYSPVGVSSISQTNEHPENDSPEKSEYIIKIPVALRGQQIGQLSLTRKSNESPWTETEQEMADKIAIQVALAVENARLLEESQRRALREQTVNDLSSRFSRSLNVDTLLQNAVRELHRIPQVAEVSVYIAPKQTIKNQDNNTEIK